MLEKALSLLLAVSVMAGLRGVVWMNAAPESPAAPEAVLSPADGPGRPKIKNNTVYTAWNTPIRGTFAGIEGHKDSDRVISPDDFNIIRENGLNTLHVYLENPYTNGLTIGAQADYCDYIIEEAAKKGVYVIITIGALEFWDVVAETQYLYDFWDFYAPRYKDMENVIYELCNEMGRVPVDGYYPLKATAEVTANAYSIIRAHAPDTMVLLFTSGHNGGLYDDIEVAKLTEMLVPGGIPWTNEAFAIHSYESVEDSFGITWLRIVLDELLYEGYPVINTEVPCSFHFSGYPDIAIYSVLEEYGISWVGFIELVFIPLATRWRGRFEAEGLAWQPDYGTWPAPDAIFPFAARNAADNIAQTTSARVADKGRRVLSMSGGQYVLYNQLNFGTREPLAFKLCVKSTAGGVITARDGGPDGAVLGSVSVPPSGSGYTDISGDILTAVSGMPDIAFVFEGDGELLLRDWQFVLPTLPSYSDPLRVVDAADCPFRSGGIKRGLSTDSGSAARLQAEGITNGSALIYDYARIPKMETIRFNVRAKPISGGAIEIYTGEFKHDGGIFYFDVFPLGRCEINGTPGVWSDFNCELDIIGTGFYNYLLNDDYPRWDMALVFTGEDGKELFEISEFWFGGAKPEPAYRIVPKVSTGMARIAADNSVVITGNEFADFDEREIIEAGVLYSPAPNYAPGRKKIAAITTPFSVTINSPEELIPQFAPFYYFRAYVTTKDGTFIGGTKQFFPKDQLPVQALQLTPAAWNPAADGGAADVSIATDTYWNARSDSEAWLTVSLSSGWRNGGFSLDASQNTATAERTGTITVKAGPLIRTITVSQAGAALDAPAVTHPPVTHPRREPRRQPAEVRRN